VNKIEKNNYGVHGLNQSAKLAAI